MFIVAYSIFCLRSKSKYCNDSQGGRTRLPKFKFSAKFPVGLHVILKLQINNLIQNLIESDAKNYFDRLHLSWNSVKWSLFSNNTAIRTMLTVAFATGNTPRCHIEMSYSDPPDDNRGGNHPLYDYLWQLTLPQPQGRVVKIVCAKMTGMDDPTVSCKSFDGVLAGRKKILKGTICLKKKRHERSQMFN